MPDTEVVAATRAAEAAAGLELFVLFGSRARGDAHANSDWDFGYIGSPAFDPDALLAALVLSIGSDTIDLVDLTRASGLLRYRAARDGRPLFERESGAFARFWFDAVSFWCDVYPILSKGYDQVLAELGP